jgi:hypothetical protein
MAAIVFIRENPRILAQKGQTGEDRHAMIALLAIHRDMAVTELSKITAWKLIVRAFGFLKAQHVWPCFLQKALHEARP